MEKKPIPQEEKETAEEAVAPKPVEEELAAPPAPAPAAAEAAAPAASQPHTLRVAKAAFRPLSLLNPFLVAVAVVAAGWILWEGRQALNGEDADLAAETAPAPTVPSLKTNHPHERQGERVTVDPASLGKTNPFQEASR